jgi:DNA-directed RNA polymerase specialized sigma24 family protein
MREVDGLPMAEVAARLGLSRRAADQRWAQAIVLLCGRLASPSR